MNAHFEILDNTERDNEVKKLKEIKVCNLKFEFFRVANGTAISKATSKFFLRKIHLSTRKRTRANGGCLGFRKRGRTW